MSRHETNDELNKRKSEKVFVCGKYALQLSVVQFSEMTREFLLWNEPDCHGQHDAHQHLPAVNTHVINTKSQRPLCQGQYEADGNDALKQLLKWNQDI